MGRKPVTGEFTYDTLVALSGWSRNRIHQDVTRGVLNLANPGSVAVWLAGNGKPALRAAMASALLPTIFGTTGRGQRESERLSLMCQSEMLRTIFEGEHAARQNVAKRISKGKLLQK